ncbi:hypothetical protein [Candidatus Tisiphia endosymbiont of Nemotelus uliginosus]|uniref:hypothetical protein n=1 Tax=Candidatus Tisiphia endosymbiont of Nemotelus uliginosus TaxID=3077926 RepID=UPI0035C8D77A
MLGLQRLLSQGAKGLLSSATTGWAARSIGSKMLGSTVEPITSRIKAALIISKIGLGEAQPQTYRSLQEQAESYKLNKQVAIGTITTGSAIKAITTTSILEKMVYGGITAFVAGLFFKTSRDDSAMIKTYKDMYHATSKTVCIAESSVEVKEPNGQVAKYQYVTLADQKGQDVLIQNQPMIGKSPKFVTQPLTAEVIVQQQKDGVIFETGKYNLKGGYTEAVYESRGDTKCYTPDLYTSINMPIALTASAGVRKVLNSQFDPQDVDDALNFINTLHFLKNERTNYEQSSSCLTKFKDFIGIKGNTTEQWNQRANYLEKINAMAHQLQLSEQEDDISEDYSNNFVKTGDINQEYYQREATTLSDSIYYDANNSPEVAPTGLSMLEAADAG